MGKMKVYELAKELNVESKKVVEYLQQQGFAIKNHMGTIDENAENVARRYFGGGAAAPANRPMVKRIKKETVEAERARQEAALQQESKPTVTTEQPAPKAEAKAEKPEVKVEAKPEVKPEVKAEKPEIKPEPKPEAKAEVKESKPEEKKEKTEVKQEVKPEVKVETKPEVKPEAPKAENQQGKKEAPQAARPQSERSNQSAFNKPANQQGQQGRNDDRRRQSGNQQGGQGNQQGGRRFNDNRDNRNNDNRDNRDNRGGDNRRFDNNRPGNRDNRGNRNNGGNRPNNNRPNDNRDNRDNRGGNRSNNNNGGFQSRPAGAEVVYAAPNATGKQDTRRIDKKKTDKRDQSYNNDNYGRLDKSNKNRPKNKYKEQKKQHVEVAPATPKKVVIGETIILSELAKSMHKTASELIKKLFEMGIMATINQNLDADTATLLADEFGVEIEVRQEKIVEILEDDIDNPKDLKERPAVVTVMGHVDHGKTSLLDAIRNTRVTTTEAGGITQHIGAYQVEIQNKKITFLDTPGHEAFTAMRARGAQVTDITILVVAADDGIMPQTVEAINHSKAANVPIIVAINKVDKPSANVEKVKQELTEHGLIAEDWGGETIMVPVSAKKGEGIETLLEMILLVAEMGELRANPKRQARGTVIEAKLDRTRGPVATLLVQKGTLKIGETIVAGSVFGKVRAMNDDCGRNIRAAGPSTPVEILGFSEVPEAGETFIGIKDERDARYAAQIQAIKKREEEMRKSSKVSLDDLFAKISEGEVKELNIIIKADVRGSVEAISQSLEKLSTDEVKVRIIHVGVGAINESDVMLADASNAIIIGFNVRPDAQTRKAAEMAMVDMRLYSIIYDAIEDVKKAMLGLLAPEVKETWLGQVEVRSTFRVPKIGLVAGGYVLEGKITRNSEVRIVRDGIIIFQGKLASLKRFKDDAKEVVKGFECGIGIENYNDLKEGDIIEAFVMEETTREEL